MQIQPEHIDLQKDSESEYFIPKSRQCQKFGKSVVSAIIAQRVQESLKPDVRSEWYQSYTVPDTYLGGRPIAVPVGEVVSAAEAVK